jgi:predicted homoserine dehydrogenase-like protein
MVNKEGDVTVGPILKYRADRVGVVYTAVDGDQHGLLMGLVSWARELGLEVLCGGKFRDTGLVLDESTGTLAERGRVLPLSDEAMRFLAPIPPGQAGVMSPGRLAVLGEAGEIMHHDHEELTIAANATGLAPDVKELHHPVLRTPEIPEVLCPVEEGGILGSRGVIDVVTSLRHADGPGAGGGVFIVVTATTEYSRYILSTKGCLSNHRGSVALIYRPHHLCGVETGMSVLCAALLGLPTGATEYLPRFDVIAQVTSGKKAGGALDYEDVQTLIRPAGGVDDGAPLPLNMALWNELVPPPGSVLWKLRREQDRHFLG